MRQKQRQENKRVLGPLVRAHGAQEVARARLGRFEMPVDAVVSRDARRSLCVGGDDIDVIGVAPYRPVGPAVADIVEPLKTLGRKPRLDRGELLRAFHIAVAVGGDDVGEQAEFSGDAVRDAFIRGGGEDHRPLPGFRLEKSEQGLVKLDVRERNGGAFRDRRLERRPAAQQGQAGQQRGEDVCAGERGKAFPQAVAVDQRAVKVDNERGRRLSGLGISILARWHVYIGHRRFPHCSGG